MLQRNLVSQSGCIIQRKCDGSQLQQFLGEHLRSGRDPTTPIFITSTTAGSKGPVDSWRQQKSATIAHLTLRKADVTPASLSKVNAKCQAFFGHFSAQKTNFKINYGFFLDFF